MVLHVLAELVEIVVQVVPVALGGPVVFDVPVALVVPVVLVVPVALVVAVALLVRVHEVDDVMGFCSIMIDQFCTDVHS